MNTPEEACPAETVDPMPPTEPSKEMSDLIADYGNATFDCGEWTDESEDLPEPYDHYLLISNHARAAVRTAVASLESESAALRSQLFTQAARIATLEAELGAHGRTPPKRMDIGVLYSPALAAVVFQQELDAVNV